MIRIKRSYFRSNALIVAVIVCGQQTWAQVQKAPGGINGASLWSANGDSSDFIGNYRSINLLKLKSQADTSIPPMQGATTVFLVLKPNFTVATGAQFFELGDIVLYDNQLTHGASNTMLDFSDQQPKIITLTMQRSPRVKTNQAPSFQLVDSSLFSVAVQRPATPTPRATPTRPRR